MARITLQYLPYQTDVAFLEIKQSYIGIDHWRTAFFVHVYTSMLVLPAGFTQFSKKMLKHFPHWHRRLGYIYVGAVLLLSGPTGLLMGFYANGGIGSRIAFVLLALLWMFTTLMALLCAQQQKFQSHRNYMMRSYALALSAITLRIWKYILANNFEIPPMDQYRLIAWLGFVPNLLVAEWLIARKGLSNK
jgi:hypothetical protein